MPRAVRLLLPVLAGALVGGLLGTLIGGGVVFRGPLLEEWSRPDGGFSFLGTNGWRILGFAARLFGLPAALGGAAAALVAFRTRSAGAWRREPGRFGPALVGLVLAAVAAPAALGLYAASVLGPDASAAGAVRVRPLLTAATLCGAAGLLAGLVLARLAAWRRAPGRLR